MKRSKDYINGFQDGIKWAELHIYLKEEGDEEDFYKAVKEAVKSLKEEK